MRPPRGKNHQYHRLGAVNDGGDPVTEILLEPIACCCSRISHGELELSEPANNGREYLS
jgi:hypothetical protein